jgi:hypothetical protein
MDGRDMKDTLLRLVGVYIIFAWALWVILHEGSFFEKLLACIALTLCGASFALVSASLSMYKQIRQFDSVIKDARNHLAKLTSEEPK